MEKAKGISHAFTGEGGKYTVYIERNKVTLTNHKLDITYGLIKIEMSLADFAQFTELCQQAQAEISKEQQ